MRYTFLINLHLQLGRNIFKSIYLYNINVLPKLHCRLETVIFRNREYAQKSFAATEVIVPYSSVIFLAGRVQYIDLNFFAVQNDFLAVRIGFGRFIIFDKLRHGGVSTKVKILQNLTYNRNVNHTSSYMNCSVSADLPTPPLPTIMTLCRAGCWALFFFMVSNVNVNMCCWSYKKKNAVNIKKKKKTKLLTQYTMRIRFRRWVR